jgi:hypothetical protein
MAHLPTNRTLENITARNLRNYSDFAKNYVMDRPIKTIFEFPNISDPTPANLLSHGTGTPALAEINASEICGLTLDADTESYGFQVVLPYDLDPDEDVDFRFLWSNSEVAATGSGLFVMTYNAVHVGVGTAIAIGATALDVPVANQVDLAANVQRWTPWGTINAGALSHLVPGDDVLHAKVAIDLTVIANATLYCGQMRHYRRLI